MTKDQIDELMRENGIVVVGEAVYALCNLVEEKSAAAERERVAGYMTRRGYEPTSTNDIVEMLEEMFWFSEERFLKSVRTQVVGDALVAAVKAEREACAKVCEEIYENSWECEDRSGLEKCAEAIRARGQ